MSSLISLLFLTFLISSCATPTSKYFTYVPSSQSETAAQKNVDRYRYEEILPSLNNQNSISLDDPEVNKLGYFHNVRKAILLVWEYPAEAVLSNHEGTVGMKFRILENGEVKNIVCTKSSGHFILDESVAKAITLASPFSPLPKSFGKSALSVTGDFKFLLGPEIEGFEESQKTAK